MGGERERERERGGEGGEKECERESEGAFWGEREREREMLRASVSSDAMSAGSQRCVKREPRCGCQAEGAGPRARPSEWLSGSQPHC